MNHLLKSSIPPKAATAKSHYRLSLQSLASLFLSHPTTTNKHSSSNLPHPTLNDKITHKLTQFSSFSTTNIDKNVDASEPIDAGSSIRKPVSLWPGVYHSPVTNALWEARSNYFEKDAIDEVAIERISQDGLVSKTPSHSRTSVEYRFSSDYLLREQYRNPWNEIRMGKLVEDLDALAGTISFKVDADLSLVGSVTWVGRSSMEMQLEVLQPAHDASLKSDSVALVANFTFVARDSETGKSAPINQISPESQQEKLLWEQAEERNKMRKIKRAEQKNKTDNQESSRINELLAEGRVFVDLPALADRDSILIRDTCLQSSLVCQPQQRNIHGRIFGGFLMRKAFELAFSTVYTFAGASPRFVEVDHVDFVKPVDVGNFLIMKSCVLYTELQNPARPLINVEVVAHVTRPELRTSEVSNKFYFTFTVCPEATKNGLKIRSVFPSSEEEARRVVERMDAEQSHDS